MTAAASNTPISVDYTGRDYYAIRDQLIKRVQERVPDWQGSDPNDFGLALVEAFSYMGDLVNYYIDRIANESYILTATQRETILNIASTYGYKPASYVSASTTLDITNVAQGYRGQIGGAIIEAGDSTHTLGNYAKVIVPNDHPFTVDGTYNKIKINSMPNETSPSTLGDKTFIYNTSVFNGVFPVVNVGYDNFGKNVVWYRPSANVTGVADTTATASITAASGSGTLITYTASNTFVKGDVVTITGLGTGSGSSLNLVNVAVYSATSTQFTVQSSLIGVSSGTGTAKVPSFVITLDNTGSTLTAYSGQKILLSGVVSSGNNYNGKWVVASSTSVTDAAPNATITVKPTSTDSVASITAAKVVNSDIYYAAWNDFVVGEKVVVTGADTAAFNLSGAATAITGMKSIEGVVSKATTTGSAVTYYASEQLAVGDYVTIRRISSVGNELAIANQGYNLTNKTVSSVSSTITVTVTGVTGAYPASGQITYQTGSDHGFTVGDYVTMSGIVNVPTDAVTATDVFNLKAVKILATTHNSFTVEGYWVVSYDAAGSTSATATSYAFTLAEAVTGNILSSGSMVSEYFKVAKPGGFSETTSTFTNGMATSQTGGTYTSGGEVVYAEIPTLVVSGPYATSVGSTLVPKGTQVRTQVTVEGGIKDIIFSTQADQYVPFRETASVLAVHGEDISLRVANAADTAAKAYDIPGELLGYSNGSADQSFAVKEVQVDPRTIRVFVDTGTSWEEWAQVEHIQDYTPSSRIFEVSILASEEVRVVFGDGISGAIPTRESGIKVTYIAGGGVVGNVSANSLVTWDVVLGNDADVIRTMKVSNQYPAVGGADPESNDSIRYNAPRSLRALNRAVTLDDFSNLALAVDGVVKTNSIASSRSSVTVYVAPNSTGSAEETPGIDSDGNSTTQMESYKRLVAQYLEDKKQIGTTVTVLEPVYSRVHVEVNYSVLPQYNPSSVSTAIKKAIVDGFSYDNSDFADVITPEEVEFKLRQVEGVSNIRVTGLYRVGGSGRNSLIGEAYELFVFSESEIEVVPSETEARVSTITFVAMDSDGVALEAPSQAQIVVNPTVNGEVYAYTLSLPSGSVKLQTTVTTVGSKATVTVNDKAVTGGVIVTDAQASLDVSNTLLVTVTAEDGVSVNTYRFKVTVAS